MNKFTIVGRAQPEGMPDVAVGVEIAFHFSDDAPPTLIQAISRSVSDILTSWGREDELRKIAQECDDIRARHQRRADHAAEMLIGDAEAAPVEDLPAAIAHQFCHACGDAYGCRAVGGCGACEAVRDALPARVLFGEDEANK